MNGSFVPLISWMMSADGPAGRATVDVVGPGAVVDELAPGTFDELLGVTDGFELLHAVAIKLNPTTEAEMATRQRGAATG